MPQRTHGYTTRINGKQNKTYTCWQNMLQRCHNPMHKAFKSYGAKGITVCDRWLGPQGFANFLADMGEKPEDLSIERIDGTKGYSPDNCKWDTKKAQAVNRFCVHRITVGAETRTIDEWAGVTGINRVTIDTRIRRGWHPERAVTEMPVSRAS